MSDEVLAQARRLHMHVMNGGNVTAMDMSRLVQGMERMQAERDRLREALRLAEKAMRNAQSYGGDRAQASADLAYQAVVAALGDDRA